MFAIFFINIFNRSISVFIFNIFSNEYLILRATEDLKSSILGGFFGQMGIYIKNLIMKFCCTLFHDLLNNHLRGVFGQNLEFVVLMVFEKRCLDMTDRQTHGRTWLNQFYSSR